MQPGEEEIKGRRRCVQLWKSRQASADGLQGVLRDSDAKHIEPFKALRLICSVGLLAISIWELFRDEALWEIFLIASVGFYVRPSTCGSTLEHTVLTACYRSMG